MTITPRLNLRAGRVCWTPPRHLPSNQGPLPRDIEVAVIGAGVTGAMIAERLSAEGIGVAIFDRRPPATGATEGSTALVMWAADTPLRSLSNRIGPEGAAQAWQAVYAACQDLASRIHSLDIRCGWTPRPELYLAGDVLDAEGLREEAAIRQGAGLPSRYLDATEVARRFELPDRAGLVSDGAFSIDPVALTLGLVDQAVAHGAQLYSPTDVVELVSEGDGVRLKFAGGAEVLARHVILASGYEAARAYLPDAFSLSSSFAIATVPGQATPWREGAMIWEASAPYLYARPTADGRLIVGGLDEDSPDPRRRDALLAEKRLALMAAAKTLVGAPVVAECAWASTFGNSPDGLPAIGPAKHDPRIWLAYAFGGNGVTFASLAASLAASAIRSGVERSGVFSPERFGTPPKA